MLGTPSEHREIAATYLIDEPAGRGDHADAG
jgi:hypothetical protein